MIVCQLQLAGVEAGERRGCLVLQVLPDQFAEGEPSDVSAHRVAAVAEVAQPRSCESPQASAVFCASLGELKSRALNVLEVGLKPLTRTWAV